MSAAKMIVAVVGCGNIGSRHLQGLARMPGEVEIHGVEPSAEALALARTRVEEAKPGSGLKFTFHEKLEDLPKRLDVAIIATGAAVRRSIIEHMLGQGQVGAFILEKFLFQKLGDYTPVEKLITARGGIAYVNTPRRIWPAYEALRTQFLGQGPITMTVELGRANGLASNAIHFLDLATYLGGSSSGFRLDGSRLMPIGGVNRHAGALEFRGVLSGFSGAGDALIIRSRPDTIFPHIITIAGADRRIIIDEPKNQAFTSTAAGQWAFGRIDFPVVYQSTLTGTIVAELLRKRYCGLPSLAESTRLHRQNLGAFLMAMGVDPNDEDLVCPIT